MIDTTKEIKEVYERIKSLRQFKKLSQEAMAEKLGMSINGYANIERGETDISLARLHQISQVLEVDLLQLLSLNGKGILYLIGSYNFLTQPQHTQLSNSFLTCPLEPSSLKIELEKTQLLLEQKTKENSLLQQQIDDLREMVQLLKMVHPN